MSIELPSDATERICAEGFLKLAASKTILDAIETTFSAAATFFSSPPVEKLGCRLPLHCGYRPCGEEYSTSADIPDALESFTVSERTRGDGEALGVRQGRDLHAKMMVAFSLLETLAEAIVQRVAQDVSNGALRPGAGGLRRWSRLQLNHARPKATTNDFINELHEDGHFLTIVKSTGSGLEVQSPLGEFVAPSVAPSEIMVMPGRIAWLMSGGDIRPLHHRVRKLPDQHDRLALLFFADIAPQACTPWKQTAQNAGIDIAQCVRSNSSRFGVLDFPEE